MSFEEIIIKGAREHNLKNIDLVIPRNRLVLITGVSGSGKSSLAFDTIYAEGQRRYVESLSAYARQFLGRVDKPDVDYIEGLSPAISIDQKGASHNPRSTVGTVTEIYDYLRLLFSRVGIPHCPQCMRPVHRQSVQQIVDSILEFPSDSRIMVLAPVVRDRKGEYKELFENIRKQGFVRVRVDGNVRSLSESISLARYKQHSIEVVVDRLIISDELEGSRVYDSVETAMKLANGVISIADIPLEEEGDGYTLERARSSNSSANSKKIKRNSERNSKDLIFSENFACPYCNISFGEIEPRSFSFNNPHGACSGCTGLGYRLEPDPELIVPDKSLSLSQGAIVPWSRSGPLSSWHDRILQALALEYGFSMDVPVSNLSENIFQIIMHGGDQNSVPIKINPSRSRYFRRRNRVMTFEGVVKNILRRHKETESEYSRIDLERYMTRKVCPDCKGSRLKPEAVAVQVCGMNIMELCNLTIEGGLDWVISIQADDMEKISSGEALNSRGRLIGNQILKEIETRLKFLLDIGLDYLNLARTASTLSGGESQRIRLATQIGSGLMGVLYVCDEPTIGLHPADDYRLINTLEQLRDLGNTVIIVEHDEAMIRASDYIVDMGPGAGEAGGKVVATGNIQQIKENPDSVTGAYLSGRRRIPLPEGRRKGTGESLRIRNVRANNLKNIDVEFPLGMLVCVTGVSGSGKSTLVNDVLFRGLAQHLHRSKEPAGEHKEILGMEFIDKVVNIDQSPIGRTPRSNPVTYTGAFTPIRELFSQLPEARIRGYKPGRFSFNVKGGRCDACDGAGYIQIEMQFLPDVTVPCESCKGLRYNREALEVKLRGYSISDVLNMTVLQGLELFSNMPRICSKLETLRDVGLGYIRLGQPATTLSGGEAQRVKLSTELSKKATGKTLYILDEPTTGLSFEDVAALMRVLHRLVDQGSTVLIIEHHMDVVKNADWIIDLGPQGGNRGGKVIVLGTPEAVASDRKSLTGRYLRGYLNT